MKFIGCISPTFCGGRCYITIPPTIPVKFIILLFYLFFFEWFINCIEGITIAFCIEKDRVEIYFKSLRALLCITVSGCSSPNNIALVYSSSTTKHSIADKLEIMRSRWVAVQIKASCPF